MIFLEKMQFPKNVRLAKVADVAYRASAPEARQQALEALHSLSGTVSLLAAKAGIEPPLIVIEGSKGEFEASDNYMDHNGFFSMKRRPALFINPIFIRGMEALSRDDVLRPDLKFTQDELFAVLAHDVAHLACPHHWVHARMKEAEHPGKSRRMHADELEADKLAASYGATVEAFTDAFDKMQQQTRLVVQKMADEIPVEPGKEEKAKEAKEEMLLQGEIGLAEAREGSKSHPSFAERVEAMKSKPRRDDRNGSQARRKWQDRIEDDGKAADLDIL